MRIELGCLIFHDWPPPAVPTWTLQGNALSRAQALAQQPRSIAWTTVSVPPGASAVLDSAAVLTPTLTVSLPGTYVFEVGRGDGGEGMWTGLHACILPSPNAQVTGLIGNCGTFDQFVNVTAVCRCVCSSGKDAP